MVQGVLVQDNQIHVINPASGKLVGKVPCSTLEQVAAAIGRAKAAQRAWCLVPLAQRVNLLKKACEEIKQRHQELASTIVKEMGKVMEEAIEEVEGAYSKEEFLGLVEEANKPVEADNGRVVRDPHGVVAVCSPWNFPADEPLLLALPALAAGNSVVLKPSEVAPMTGRIVAECLQKVLPAGVFELVQGDGVVGAALVSGDVQMVAMTGSTATGKRIMASCAADLKRLVLELGGKDPMVVFADADLHKAAEDAVAFAMYNCGQVCCSVERVYVAKEIKAEFEAKCVALAKELKLGDGFDPASKVGPMVSRMQREIVQHQVEDARRCGAKLLYQGQVPPGDGNFFPPTVLTDVKQDMTISRNETFGPVLALSPFDGSEKEAIRLANDSEYGLAAYVYSKDLSKAQRVGMGIHAGQVGINNWSLAKAPIACPWVGAKGSGFGYHSGADGWRQFSVPKSLIFNTDEERKQTSPTPERNGGAAQDRATHTSATTLLIGSSKL